MDGFPYGLCLAATVALAGSGEAFAAHPLVTDDADTLGQGKFELEFGAEWSSADAPSAFEGGIQLGYGVLPNLDVTLRPAWLSQRADTQAGTGAARGLSDTSVDLKWHAFDVGIWRFALQGGAELPTGNSERGLGKGTVAWQGRAIATANLEPYYVDVNVGYEQGVDDELVLQHLFYAQLAGRRAVSATLQLVSEVGFERPSGGAGSWPAAARVGVIGTVAPWLDLDLGYQARLNHAAPRQVLIAGATLRW